jgi:hypothetical protein
MMANLKQVLLLAILAISSSVHGHSLNDSYLQLSISDSQYSGKLQIALSDLEIAIGLDADYNQELTWGELKSASPLIDAYIHERFSMQAGEQICESNLGPYRLEELSGGVYLNIPLQGECRSSGDLSIGYSMLFDVDSSHRGIASISQDGKSSSYVFSPRKQSIEFDSRSSGLAVSLLNFIFEGIWHIWIGIDHVLFILAMLFGVILRQQNSTNSKPSWSKTCLEVVKLVTAFTFAHSLTLLLSTLGLVRLQEQFVESAIALSVLAGGINILFPIFGNHHWKFAFLFGLIHGFGFANVLMDLELSTNQLIAGLLGFNLGVEFGQFIIVAITAPILVFMCKRDWTRRIGSIAGGIVVSQMGLFWFFQRGLGM